MIGILTEDHNLHLVNRSQLKSLEYLRPGRENDSPLSLLLMELPGKSGEIRLLKLPCQGFLPTLFYLDVHYLRNYQKISAMTSSMVLT